MVLETFYEPMLPPVPELIMAIPNVIIALALTNGAQAVLMLTHFHPCADISTLRHAMPKSGVCW
jgi:hypothetical protein